MLGEHSGFVRPIADNCASGLGQRLLNPSQPPGIPVLSRIGQALSNAVVAARTPVLINVNELLVNAALKSAGSMELLERRRERRRLPRWRVGHGFVLFNPTKSRTVRIAGGVGPLLADTHVGNVNSDDLVEYVIADPMAVIRSNDQRWYIDRENLYQDTLHVIRPSAGAHQIPVEFTSDLHQPMTDIPQQTRGKSRIRVRKNRVAHGYCRDHTMTSALIFIVGVALLA